MGHRICRVGTAPVKRDLGHDWKFKGPRLIKRPSSLKIPAQLFLVPKSKRMTENVWNDHGGGESSEDGSATGSNLSIYVKGCNREVEGYAEGGVEGEDEGEAEGDVQEDAGATARKLPTSNAPNQNGNVMSLALLPEFINSCSSEADMDNCEHSTTVQDRPKPGGMLIDGDDTRLLDGGQIDEDDDSDLNSGNTNSDCLSSYSRPRVVDLGHQDEISDDGDSTESCSEEEDDYSKAQGRTKQTKIDLDLNKLSQPAAEIDEMMAFAKK